MWKAAPQQSVPKYTGLYSFFLAIINAFTNIQNREVDYFKGLGYNLHQ